MVATRTHAGCRHHLQKQQASDARRLSCQNLEGPQGCLCYLDNKRIIFGCRIIRRFRNQLYSNPCLAQRSHAVITKGRYQDSAPR